MKYFTKLLILFLVLSVPCMAKIKVVQKSAKKAPVWMNATQKDYIITSASSGDIEQAKNECLDNIRKYIIDAVAQNVKSTSESSISQESVNNEITKFLDKYNYSAQTQSANVPYLTGISASKIEDSYWEKRENTDTKEISYLYAVKYPFPSLELKKLVHEFQKKDSEMNGKFNKLEADYRDITSVEQIDKAITDLNVLIGYFFDDTRKSAARNLQQNYRQLYKQITLREVSNKPGLYVFALALGGKEITISQRPVVKSETLSQMRTEQDGKNWQVFYNYETCDPSEENSATVSFRIGGRPLIHEFYVDVNQDKIRLMPTREMYLTATRKDSLLTNIVVRMNLDCKSARKVRIYQVTLDVPGLDKPLFIDNQNLAVEGKGLQTLQVTYSGSAILLSAQNYRSNLLKGHLEVLDEENRTHRVDFSLPFKANW